MLACLGLWSAFRVTLVEDITTLLPDQRGGDGSLIGLTRQHGLMKKVIVVLGPDGPSADRLHRAVDVLADELVKLDGIGEVFGRVDSKKVRRGVQIITEHAARLYRPEYVKIGPKEVPRRLEQLKRRLATPEAIVMQPYLLSDPLGLGHEALSSLEAAGQAMGATVDRGRLVSRDLRSALMVVEIDFDPLDVNRARVFIKELDRVVALALERASASGLEVTTLGGVHFVVSSADAIISDVQMAFILTIIGVVAIFFLFFRRIRMLPAALLPAGAGMAVATSAMVLLGEELHALTIGFAATITGISVDYAIHLLYEALSGRGGTSVEKMGRAVGLVARPLTLGCLTTVGAFLLVATSNFRGIRQLAIFSAISVPVALIVTLLVLPAFHGFLFGSSQRRKGLVSLSGPLVGSRFPKWRIALFGGLFGAGLWWSAGVTISGDPRDLGHEDHDLVEREKLLGTRFPGLHDQAFLVASGRTCEEALWSNDALYSELRSKGFDRTELVSVSPILPSKKTQERSLAAAGELFGKEVGRGASKLFEEAGFSAEYFDSIKNKLKVTPVEQTTYRNSSLERIVSDAVWNQGGRCHVLTRVRAQGDGAVNGLIEIADSVVGCRLVSERLETRAVLIMLQKEIIWMLTIWLGAALLVLSLSERSLFFGLRATLPAIFGVSMAVGLFGLIGRPLTPVASAGITLVMGLGIDYGILMQPLKARQLTTPASASLASALTTVAAFGVLALARTKAMADLGLIVLVGVSAALITALLLLPALSRRHIGGVKE